ncbi:cohesin complex subunit [Savitreella phatthalungensis]
MERSNGAQLQSNTLDGRKRGKTSVIAAQRKRSKTAPSASELEDRHNEVLNDNEIFTSLLDPDSTASTTAADVLDAFQSSPHDTLAELVNCLLRIAGSRHNITAFDVQDSDSARDTLAQIQENLITTDSTGHAIGGATYPLVSMEKHFRTLRKTLPSFVRQLTNQIVDRELIVAPNEDEQSFFDVVEKWISSMSAANLRSFRHSATTFALQCITAFVDRIAALESEISGCNAKIESAQRKGNTAHSRQTQLSHTRDTKTELVQTLKTTVGNLIDEIFVHRYRDVDWHIRTDCIKALGDWMTRLPGVFYDGAYLRYVGWQLSDPAHQVRMAAVKLLPALYAMDDYVAGLRHFTSKFKARLLEMASSDADSSVRSKVLFLAQSLRERGFLNEGEVKTLLLNLYDAELRVREAAAALFAGVLDERWENHVSQYKKKLGHDAVHRIKVLAQLFADLERTPSQRLAPIGGVSGFGDTSASEVAASSIIPHLDNLDASRILQALSMDDQSAGQNRLSSEEQLAMLRVLGAYMTRTSSDKQQSAPGCCFDFIASASKLLKCLNSVPATVSILATLHKIDLCSLTEQFQLDVITNLMSDVGDIFLGFRDEQVLNLAAAVMMHMCEQQLLITVAQDKMAQIFNTVRLEILHEIRPSETSLLRIATMTFANDHSAEWVEDQPTLFDKVVSYIDEELPRHRKLACRGLLAYFLWRVQRLATSRFGIDHNDLKDVIDRRDLVLQRLESRLIDDDEELVCFVLDLETMMARLAALLPSTDSCMLGRLERPLAARAQKQTWRVLCSKVSSFAKINHKKMPHLEWPEHLGDDTADNAESESDSAEGIEATQGRQSTMSTEDERTNAETAACRVAKSVARALLAQKLDRAVCRPFDQVMAVLGSDYDILNKQVSAGFAMIGST